MENYSENKYYLEPRLLHGGDYNPDQWLKYPDILAKDIEYMKETLCNTFSVGIFAWSALEPSEGSFNFAWLDKIMDNIADIGGNVILATPSGARPAWLSQKYPSVLRVNANRQKMLHGARHNHCFSSLDYREKVRIINRELAQRYKNHPALFMWHVSNEYSGECHCELCQENFRSWLKNKYKNLENLNDSYWSAFWSHQYSDFSQIQSPSQIGETSVHALNLDWRRFVSHQTIDFYKNEISSLREITPNTMITTNFMGDFGSPSIFDGFDHAHFAKEVDIISWDAYPNWHNDYETTEHLASKLGIINDHFRTLKDKPFLILESTPSLVNWHSINKAKRPGMHLLSSIACVAHGSDAIMYFQWRSSRGSAEKMHGTVVGHDNSNKNRVFKDVAELGAVLENIKEVKNSQIVSKVALFYDIENLWALSDCQGFQGGLMYNDKKYRNTIHMHYREFWKRNISVDIVTKDKELHKYDLVIVPMLYMIDDDTIQSFKKYVENGGRLVATYIFGVVDENDLAYLEGMPNDLAQVFGIDIKETDTLYTSDRNEIAFNNGKKYEAYDYCTILETTTAQTLAKYTKDFYEDTAAVTKNKFKNGFAYFVGARTGEGFLKDFYDNIIKDLQLPVLPVQAEDGVSIQTRQNEEHKYYFVMNFTENNKKIVIDHKMQDLVSNMAIDKGEHILKKYEVYVLRNKK